MFQILLMNLNRFYDSQKKFILNINVYNFSLEIYKLISSFFTWIFLHAQNNAQKLYKMSYKVNIWIYQQMWRSHANNPIFLFFLQLSWLCWYRKALEKSLPRSIIHFQTVFISNTHVHVIFLFIFLHRFLKLQKKNT